MKKCPNTSDPVYIFLEKELGKIEAYRIFIKFDGLPDMSVAKKLVAARKNKFSLANSSIEVPSDIYDELSDIKQIGNKDEYQKYLGSVFPGSQIKDVIYHGTKNKFDRFSREQIGSNKGSSFGKGFYFSRSKEEAAAYAKTSNSFVIAAIVNSNKVITMSNSSPEDFRKATLGQLGDTVIVLQGREIVTFDPERIHILGTKDDVEGFKKWKSESTQTEDAPKKERDIQLEAKLKDILTNVGIKVQAYDTLVYKLGVDAAGAADILNRIVYISDKAGYETLPEEVAHFFIEGLGDSNPLVKRLMDNISEHPVYKEVLEEYKDVYDTDEQFRKEAIGKLLGKYIVQEYKNTEGGLTIWQKFRGTLDLILDRIMKMFSKLKGDNQIEKSVEEIYGDMAEQVLKGNISVSNTPNIYYQVKGQLKTLDVAIKEKLKAINTRLDYYERAVGDDARESSERVRQFVADTREKLKIIDELKETSLDEAYVKLLDTALDDLKSVSERVNDRMSSIATSRALSFVDAYKGLSDIKTDNEVIKKSAADVDLLRKEIKDKLLTITQERLLEKFEIPIDPNKTLEELLIPESDISWDQRWLGALANSNDPLLAHIDKLYKREVLDYTTEKFLDFEQQHDKLLAKVDKADMKYLFNKDTGKFTERYINEYYELLWETNKLAKENPDSHKQIWRSFFEANHYPSHRDENGNWVKGGPLPQWEDPNYDIIQSKPSLKAYYDFVIKNKHIADNMMGMSRYKSYKYRLPHFKADFTESIAKNGLVKAITGIGSRFKDLLVYDRDTSQVILDEKGEEVKSIIRPGTGSGNNQSFDIPYVIKAYIGGALAYKAKRDIQGTIELAKTYAQARELPRVNWKGKVIDQSGDFTNIDGASSLAYQRFTDWYNMIYIGETEKDEGAYKILGKNISKQKLAKAFGRYNALTSLTLNLFSGVANVVYGGAMQVIESAGGEFYSAKDYGWATKTYASSALSRKMDLMLDYFRVLQDTSEYGKKTKGFHKLLNPFMFNQAGEHMLQTRLFLAIAHNYKLRDSSGKEYNLWDAYDEVDGKLKLKEGIELNSRDRSDFISKVSGINQRLHGRYTTEDQAALNKYALGYLAMQYRKWIHPGFEARFRAPYYDQRLNQVVKGRYRSYVDFFSGIKEMKSLVRGWSNLSPHDKANMKRNIAELVYFTGTLLLLSALRSMAEDDEDLDESKSFNFFMYQIDRFSTEVKFFNIGIFTGDLTKLIRTPAASISTIENMGRLLNDTIRYPFRDEEENMVRGKEYSKVQRDSEKLLPLIKEIRRWSNVEDQANYFRTY
jgi:hypothetical protein